MTYHCIFKDVHMKNIKKIKKYMILVNEYINMYNTNQRTPHVIRSDDKTFFLIWTSSVMTKSLVHCHQCSTFYDVLFVYLGVQAALKPGFVTELLGVVLCVFKCQK